jgi:hypothetical protein
VTDAGGLVQSLLEAERVCVTGASTAGEAPPPAPEVLVLTFSVACASPKDVWARVASVVISVNARRGPWPEVEEWAKILPTWFVEACAPPRSEEEDEREYQMLRSLSAEARAEYESLSAWELEGWIGWMEPGERPWFLLGHEEHADRLELTIGFVDEPVLGALDWLVRSSGGERLLKQGW